MLLISNLQILCPKFGKPIPRLNLDDVENVPEREEMLDLEWCSCEAWDRPFKMTKLHTHIYFSWTFFNPN